MNPEAHGRTVALYLDAMEAALEICRDHGLATGHGDTLADILREINGQMKERDRRADMAKESKSD